MRLSEIQKRRHLPEDAQRIPVRRAIGWVFVAFAIAFGVYLFFRLSGRLSPLLD
ncbi:MAG: hypothetical protein H0X64_12530 [Gemmatimonadaceae bacterium]|nr:hypothetical protein [Gemmatimonadaceae bacterium]